MGTTVKIDLLDATRIISNHGLAPGGFIQKFVTNELLRISSPYTPFKGGVLENTVVMMPDFCGFEYIQPYARYLWEGKLMVDPITGKGAFFSPTYGFWSRPGVEKELTDTDLKFNGAPLRGPKWVERAYMDNKQALLSSVEQFANRGGI